MIISTIINKEYEKGNYKMIINSMDNENKEYVDFYINCRKIFQGNYGLFYHTESPFKSGWYKLINVKDNINKIENINFYFNQPTNLLVFALEKPISPLFNKMKDSSKTWKIGDIFLKTKTNMTKEVEEGRYVLLGATDSIGSIILTQSNFNLNEIINNEHIFISEQGAKILTKLQNYNSDDEFVQQALNKLTMGE